nr:putative secreted protein [Quercus suber]
MTLYVMWRDLFWARRNKYLQGLACVQWTQSARTLSSSDAFRNRSPPVDAMGGASLTGILMFGTGLNVTLLLDRCHVPRSAPPSFLLRSVSTLTVNGLCHPRQDQQIVGGGCVEHHNLQIIKPRTVRITASSVKMKTTTVLSSLALAGAVNAQGLFGTLNLRSASPIHFTTLSASGLRIWINKPTATYCPDSVASEGACPNSTSTNFAGGNDTLSMGAIVPGGQQVSSTSACPFALLCLEFFPRLPSTDTIILQVYIDPTCGALAYTQAHSSYMPTGAISTGFTNDPVADRTYGFLKWNGDGFLACPTNATSNVYQVFAPLEGITFPEDCLGFDVESEPATNADAWQYT